jgi:hypothetical protein
MARLSDNEPAGCVAEEVVALVPFSACRGV